MTKTLLLLLSCIVILLLGCSPNTPTTPVISIQQEEKISQANLTEWIPYRKGKKWYFVNDKDEFVLKVDRKYEVVYPFQNEFAMVEKNGRYGVIDKKGMEVIPCILERKYEVQIYNAQVLRLIKIDTLNIKSTRTSDLYRWQWKAYNLKTQELSEEYYEFPIKIVGRYGKSKEDDTYKIKEYFLKLKVNHQWGIFDTLMNNLIPPQYEKIHVVGDYILAQKERKWYQMDLKGKVYEQFDTIIQDNSIGYSKPHWIVGKNKLFGLLNEKGEPILPVEYQAIIDQRIIKKNDKFGLRNLEGEIILPLEYDTISPLGIMKKEGKFGLCNMEGQILYPCEFDTIMMVPGIWNFAKKGQQIYQFKIGKGKPVLTQYDDIRYTSPNYWVTVTQNQKQGILKGDDLIVPIEYDSIKAKDQTNSTYFDVKKEGKWSVFNTTAWDRYRNYSGNYFELIEENGKYGVLNFENKVAISPQYDTLINVLKAKVFKAQKDRKWGLIDYQNNVLLPITQDFHFHVKTYDLGRYEVVQAWLKDDLFCEYVEKTPEEITEYERKGAEKEAKKQKKYEKQLEKYQEALKEYEHRKQTGYTGPIGKPRPPRFDDSDSYYHRRTYSMSEPKIKKSLSSIDKANLPCTCQFKIRLLQSPAGADGADGQTGPSGSPLSYQIGKDGYYIEEEGRQKFEEKYLHPPLEDVKPTSNLFDYNKTIFGKMNGKWGVFRNAEQVILYPQYDEIFKVRSKQGKKIDNGKFMVLQNYVVYKNNQWMTVNECGEVIQMLPNKEVLDNHYRVTVLERNGKKGLVNIENDIIAPFIFDEIRTEQYCFIAQKRDSIILFNKKGEKQKSLDYEKIEPLSNKLLAFKNGKYGLLTFDGKELLKAEYDSIYTNEEVSGNLLVERDNKKGLFTTYLRKLIEPQYEELVLRRMKDRKTYLMITDTGTGLFDEYFKELIPPLYESIEKVSNTDLYLVKKDGRYGFMDAKFLKKYFED